MIERTDIITLSIERKHGDKSLMIERSISASNIIDAYASIGECLGKLESACIEIDKKSAVLLEEAR